MRATRPRRTARAFSRWPIDRKLAFVVTATTLEEGDTCHLLFVSRDEETDLSSVLPGLRGRCVLTVGEGREFAAGGGIVSFVVAKQRVGLTVNLDASRDAGLEISSKLLDVASIVDGSE